MSNLFGVKVRLRDAAALRVLTSALRPVPGLRKQAYGDCGRSTVPSTKMGCVGSTAITTLAQELI